MECTPSWMYYAICVRPVPSVHRLVAVLVVLLYVASAREDAYVPAAPAGAQSTVPAAPAAQNTAPADQRGDVSVVSSAHSLTQSAASAGPPEENRRAGMNYNLVDKVACEKNRNRGIQLGAPPRRLALSRAFLSIIAQYIFHTEMRRLLKRTGYRMAEVVKGVPTEDYELNYFQQKESCRTVFDFINEWGVLGPVRADTVEIKFLPAQHRGVLTYTEDRSSNVEFLKPIQRHVQSFLLPHGCTATSNSTWTAYCTSTDPPCVVGRIDISTSLVPEDERLVPLQPVDNETFNGKLLADGWEWFEVQDLYEAIPNYPKPVHMTWAYDHCMLHAYFETKAVKKTQYFWMKGRQAFQIMIEQVDGTPYRKMSAFPPACGGGEAKDFVVTVATLKPPGNYKAIMSTKIYGESITTAPDEITLKKEEPLLPLENWDPDEEEIDFIELFPDAHAAPLYELESGPFE